MVEQTARRLVGPALPAFEDFDDRHIERPTWFGAEADEDGLGASNSLFKHQRVGATSPGVTEVIVEPHRCVRPTPQVIPH
jgi:hypothetical protein